MDSDFPKFSFSLESVNFYHWQQMLSVVFLGITDSLYLSFKNLSARYINLNNHSLFFFQIKMVFQEKNVKLCNSSSCISAFSLDSIV